MKTMPIRMLQLCCGSALAALCIAPAAAQSADTATPPEPTDASTARNSNGLADIIVTARRRQEALQSVPVAVTAITPEALRSQGIVTANDLQAVTPSLSIQNNGLVGRETSLFNIRGQGASFGGLLPSVITYFADVPLDAAGGASVALYDLSSVQVLRGPQGTLFGRNTNGGAVVLTPTAPGHDFDGFADLSVGNLSAIDFKGGVTLPVTQTLSVRLSTNIIRRDGFTKNLQRGGALDNRNTKSWRAYVRFEPTDWFSNDLIYSGLDTKTRGTSFIIEKVFPTAAGALLTPGLIAQQALGRRKVNFDNSIFGFRQKSMSLIDTAKFDLDPITIKGVFGYQRLKVCSGQDLDGTSTVYQFTTCFRNPLTVNLPIQPETNLRIFTGELQVSGTSFNDRLDWVVGGFLSDSRTPNDLDEPVSYRTSATGPSRNISQLATHDKSKALYAQGTIKFTDELRLTAGVRETWDNRKLGSGQLGSNDSGATFFCRNRIFGVPSNADFSTCFTKFQSKFKGTTYNFSLDYEVLDKTLLYVSIKRGYKSGGNNNVTISPITLYKPEFVTEYEGGIKSDFEVAGIQARTNLAVFHDDFKDIQRVASGVAGNPPTVFASVINVPKAGITGVELEATLIFNQNFRIFGNYSYLSPEPYRGFIDGGRDVSASRYFGVSKHSGSATAEYQTSIGRDSRLVASATAVMRSSAANQPNTIANTVAILPGYTLINGRLELRDLLPNLNVAVWGRNIGNKYYKVGGSLTDALGYASYTYGEPRTFGVEAVYHFGQ